MNRTEAKQLLPKQGKMIAVEFGRLIVIRGAGTRNGRRLWRCRCECGTIKNYIGTNLRCGHTTSCGCYQIERARKSATTHGVGATHKRTKEYRAWSNAKDRCTNSRHRYYKDYGGRGISMCKRWLNSFPAFLADMGNAPKGLSLDREDNSRGYEPGNCRWATSSQQASNRRSKWRDRATEDGTEHPCGVMEEA